MCLCQPAVPSSISRTVNVFDSATQPTPHWPLQHALSDTTVKLYHGYVYGVSVYQITS